MATSRILAVLWAAGVGAAPALAQSAPASSGPQLERLGRYEEAATAYARLLADEPVLASALLGLERSLTRLGRLESIRPFLDRALTADPRHELIREIEFRVVGTLHGSDSVAAAAARWIRATPESGAPYRQWALWLVSHDAGAQALAVLDRGEASLGGDGLAPTRAQIHVALGEWLEAAEYWRRAVGDNGGFTLAAAASLARAPDDRRDALLEIILGPRPGVAAGMLGADLLVRWDRPEEAWALLDGTLPEDDPAAMGVLRRFAESAGQLGTIAGFRARGYALERLAARLNGAEALRTRTEAARSFAEAGDAQSAQRLLSRRSRERMVDARDEAAAMATLIRVWIDAGRLEDAEARLGEWRDRLSGDDLAALRERLAWRWVVRAELDRAERWIGDDSTVGMRAIRGWVALYRGNIAEAKALFRSAGPYAQSREEATHRAHMLVQLERIEAERIPALGEALLVLARGDSAAAVRQLRRVAERLPPRGGRAELLTMTGELASALGDADTAEEALEQALAADSLGPVAPAAEYALAVLYVERGRNPEAVARLEHLILTYGESAVVPQARRLLDQIRGTIPRS